MQNSFSSSFYMLKTFLLLRCRGSFFLRQLYWETKYLKAGNIFYHYLIRKQAFTPLLKLHLDRQDAYCKRNLKSNTYLANVPYFIPRSSPAHRFAIRGRWKRTFLLWGRAWFYTPWKHQKAFGFLVISKYIKWEHWSEMG